MAAAWVAAPCAARELKLGGLVQLWSTYALDDNLRLNSTDIVPNRYYDLRSEFTEDSFHVRRTEIKLTAEDFHADLFMEISASYGYAFDPLRPGNATLQLTFVHRSRNFLLPAPGEVRTASRGSGSRKRQGSPEDCRRATPVQPRRLHRSNGCL